MAPRVPQAMPSFADADLQLFWEALQRAKVVDGFLHLDGAFFMGDKLRGRELLMRDCYGPLLGCIQSLLGEGLCRFLITGIGIWGCWLALGSGLTTHLLVTSSNDFRAHFCVPHRWLEDFYHTGSQRCCLLHASCRNSRDWQDLF